MGALLYRVFYMLGMTPWERLLEFPAANQLVRLIDDVERDRQHPFGSVLDLGCGTGNWSLRLARRGWDVTGVELVPKAVQTARTRAQREGLDIRFLEGDVSRLEDALTSADFRLILDIGTVHGLQPRQRESVGRFVSAATCSGASLLMYAFVPARRGPLPAGMGRAEIESTYPEWQIVEDLPFDLTGMPDSVRKDAPHWYRLVRR